MTKLYTFSIVFLLSLFTLHCTVTNADENDSASPRQDAAPALDLDVDMPIEGVAPVRKDLGYVLGYIQGSNIIMMRIELDVPLDEDILFAAIDDAQAGREPAISEEEIQSDMMAFQMAMMQMQQNPDAAQELLQDINFKTVMYVIGYQMLSGLDELRTELGLALDSDDILAGVRDALSGSGSRISDADMEEMLMAFQQEMMAKQQEMMARQQQDMAGKADENKAKGIAFLAENREKDGVEVTESGLQYIILEEGEGDAPAETDTVEVHYKGTLIDGTVFDSSYDRGVPATFPLQGVIKGWTEGVQLMRVGGKARLFVPPELGYGSRGMPPAIGPNETLIFDVELIDIK